jgi:AFG3 family protein
LYGNAGMNDKVGMLSYRMDREAFDKPYSNETAHMIDTEVRATYWDCLDVFR